MPTAPANSSTDDTRFCTPVCGDIINWSNITTSVRSQPVTKLSLNPVKSDLEDALGFFMRHGAIEMKVILDPAHFLKAAIRMAKQKPDGVGAHLTGAGDFLKGFYHKIPWPNTITDQMHSLQGWVEIIEGETLGALNGDKDPPSENADDEEGEL